MILKVVILRDSSIDCFTNPRLIGNDYLDEYINICRSLSFADEKTVGLYNNYEFYYLGTFDDETGNFSLVDKVFVGDFKKICKPLIAKFDAEHEKALRFEISEKLHFGKKLKENGFSEGEVKTNE